MSFDAYEHIYLKLMWSSKKIVLKLALYLMSRFTEKYQKLRAVIFIKCPISMKNSQVSQNIYMTTQSQQIASPRLSAKAKLAP